VGTIRSRGRRPRTTTASAAAVRVVWTTVPARNAPTIARALVEEGLAACVTAIGDVRSVYRWRGKVERARETLLVIKVATRSVRSSIARLLELHPYEVPEVLVLRPEAGLAAYLRWVVDAGGPVSA
jgi:periplasmic divalent cation tolerance protein